MPTGRIACAGCRAIVEERLRLNPHVLGVHVDDARQEAHVTIHRGMVTAEELVELVAGAPGVKDAQSRIHDLWSNPVPASDGHSHRRAFRRRLSQRRGKRRTHDVTLPRQRRGSTRMLPS